MDLIDLSFPNIVVSKKKAIPVRYQKRYQANLSNSAFNQSFALGVYKRKVKSLLENNKCLVAAVQNYRCESSLKEKMWSETSSVNMEHIFSARLKLNKLAEVLKEASLSVEEILSVLQLCSSVFPSEFTISNRKSCSKNRRRRSKATLIEPIKEAQELLSIPGNNFLTDVLLSNQDGSNPLSSSTLKDYESGSKSNSIDFSTESNEIHESVKLTDLTSSLTKTSLSSATKIPKGTNKLCVTRRRVKRKPSISNASKRLPSKNSQAIKCIANSNEVLPALQDDPQQAIMAKKSKISIEPTAMNAKQHPMKPNVPLSSKKSNKRSYAKDPVSEESNNENSSIFSDKPNLGSNASDLIDQFEAPVTMTGNLAIDPLSFKKCNTEGKNKNTLGQVSKNQKAENFYNESNHASGTFDVINQSETPVSTTMSCLITNQDNCVVEINQSNLPEYPEKDEAQSHGILDSSCVHDQNLHDSGDVVHNDSFESTAKPKAQKSSKTDEDFHDPCSNNSTSYLNESNNVNSFPKSIMVSGNKKSPTKKCRTRSKVNFCFNGSTIDKKEVKSNQNKKKRSRIPKVSENEKSVFNCMSPPRPILQSVENISCLNENLSKNIFVVSAEVHPPPSHCVPIKKQSISSRNINRNLQPCVLLTDIMETHKSIVSCDSLEDLSSCSQVPVKEGSSSKASKHGKKDSIIDAENSLRAPQQPARNIARCRSAVTYREPSLNKKLRRI